MTIIWAKPNPMPESVRDRCTTAHEYLFLLTKSARYYYDGAAIKEPAVCVGDTRHLRTDRTKEFARPDNGRRVRTGKPQAPSRNKRSVWTVATAPFPGAHFATFPPALIEPCILAGCPAGGTVLDPFLGAGTTALVADRLGRHCYRPRAQPGLCGDGARPDRRPQIGARGGVGGAALHGAAARGGARHGADLGALRLRRARLRARLVVRRLQRLRLPDNAARLRRRAGRRRRAQRRL